MLVMLKSETLYVGVWKAQTTVIMCMCRYDGNTKEASFSIGLQAIEASRVDEVKNIIQKTFERVAQYVIALLPLVFTY